MEAALQWVNFNWVNIHVITGTERKSNMLIESLSIQSAVEKQWCLFETRSLVQTPSIVRNSKEYRLVSLLTEWKQLPLFVCFFL